MAQVQLISGIERRRRWREDQKREIVKAAFAPGCTVSEVARREDIHNAMIYKWRRELRRAETGFAQVMVKTDDVTAPSSGQSIIEVALSNGTQLRIPSTVPAELAASVIKALVQR
jgi:transposase